MLQREINKLKARLHGLQQAARYEKGNALKLAMEHLNDDIGVLELRKVKENKRSGGDS